MDLAEVQRVGVHLDIDNDRADGAAVLLADLHALDVELVHAVELAGLKGHVRTARITLVVDDGVGTLGSHLGAHVRLLGQVIRNLGRVGLNGVKVDERVPSRVGVLNQGLGRVQLNGILVGVVDGEVVAVIDLGHGVAAADDKDAVVDAGGIAARGRVLLNVAQGLVAVVILVLFRLTEVVAATHRLCKDVAIDMARGRERIERRNVETASDTEPLRGHRIAEPVVLGVQERIGERVLLIGVFAVRALGQALILGAIRKHDGVLFGGRLLVLTRTDEVHRGVAIGRGSSRGGLLSRRGRVGARLGLRGRRALLGRAGRGARAVIDRSLLRGLARSDGLGGVLHLDVRRLLGACLLGSSDLHEGRGAHHQDKRHEYDKRLRRAGARDALCGTGLVRGLALHVCYAPFTLSRPSLPLRLRRQRKSSSARITATAATPAAIRAGLFEFVSLPEDRGVSSSAIRSS